MTEAFGAVATIVIICWACLASPTTMTCPPKWWIPEGVRPSGSFVCRPPLIGTDVRDAHGILHDHSVQPPGGIGGQVYCGGRPETQPVIENDGRTVSCR